MTQKILCDRSSWGPTQHTIRQQKLFSTSLPRLSLRQAYCEEDVAVGPLWLKSSPFQFWCFLLNATKICPKFPCVVGHSLYPSTTTRGVRSKAQPDSGESLFVMHVISGLWNVNWVINKLEISYTHGHQSAIQKTFAVSLVRPFFCGGAVQTYAGEKDCIASFNSSPLDQLI